MPWMMGWNQFYQEIGNRGKCQHYEMAKQGNEL
jgi:hypothetical protein